MKWWELIIAVVVGIPLGFTGLYLAAFAISYGWHYGRWRAFAVHFLKNTKSDQNETRTEKDN